VEEDSQNFMGLGTPLASKVLLMQLQNSMCRYKKGIYTNRWFLYSTQKGKTIKVYMFHTLPEAVKRHNNAYSLQFLRIMEVLHGLNITENKFNFL
jgi:hypothetical protein